MPTRYHTVTIGDQTFQRESDTRDYTHAVVVVTTEEYKADRIAQAKRKLAELEAELVTVQAGVDAMTEADHAEVARLKAERDYLHEKVVDTLTRPDGTTYELPGPRWLSDAFKATHPGGKARDAVDAADKAFAATLPERLRRLTANVEGTKEQIKLAENIRVGTVDVTNWSRSAQGAEKLANDQRKWAPHKHIYVTSDITVTESKPRAKKEKPVAQAKVEKPAKVEKTEAECPVCHTKVALSDAEAVKNTFGFRAMRGKQYRQSNCRKCRGKSKPAAPEAPAPAVQ